jgi:hypothetical protein
MNRSSPFFRFRFFAPLMFLPLLVGCLVIEKKTLVLMIPEKSEEIQMYYLFEGMSIFNHHDSTVEKTVDHLRALGANHLTFFVLGSRQDSSLLEYVRFQDLNYYLDPNRERKLCAQRQVTITDRTKFVDELNLVISDFLYAQEDIHLPVDPFRRLIQKKIENQKQNKESSDALGIGALNKVSEGLSLLLNELDDESLNKFLVSARKATAWIHLENGTIQIVLPTTRECAKKICSGEIGKKWPKEMESFISPLELKATEEGIMIVIGKKGQPIRLQFTDSGDYQKDSDLLLLDAIGPVDPITIDGKPANGKQLLERFIEETNKPKKK